LFHQKNLTHTRGQIFFDAVDQLRETDRLGQEWMSLDSEAGSSLGLRHQSSQKDNRDSVQCGIGLNPSSDFAAIGFRHCDIEENKVWLKALGCLMSFARVVFFTNEVPARSLKRELRRVRKIAVVVDYQDACLLFDRFRDLWEKICFDRSVHNFP
jgi:hypothetical protein